MRKGLLWISVCLAIAALGLDFYAFRMRFHFFQAAAALGREQVPVPPTAGEVIVVLTGDMGRIPRALDLLRSRPESRLVISGAGRGVNLRELVNQQGASMADLGQIWDRITVESNASSTVENALFTLREMSEKPARILLVTSDYHMGRALAIFTRAFPGTEILPYAVSSQPAGSRFSYFWKTGAEYWKTVAYRLVHWGAL